MYLVLVPGLSAAQSRLVTFSRHTLAQDDAKYASEAPSGTQKELKFGLRRDAASLAVPRP